MFRDKMRAAIAAVALTVGATTLLSALPMRPATAGSTVIIIGGDRDRGGWGDHGRWRDQRWRHDRGGRGELFDRLDRNDDNRLSRSEFRRGWTPRFNDRSRDQRRRPAPDRDWYSSYGAWRR